MPARKPARQKKPAAPKKRPAGKTRPKSPKSGSLEARPLEARKTRALKILALLKRAYPESHCALHFKDAYQLSVATILSAQCTDKRVNLVTPELFRRWPTAGDLSKAAQGEVEEVIRSTGFYRNKAKSLVGFAKAVTNKHGGKIPGTMEELIHLPGFGRKTANVILGNAYGVPGITVDTHVGRLSARMGLTSETNPVKVEQDLMALLPPSEWTMFSHRMIDHGRAVCDARKPRCGQCAIEKVCLRIGAR